MGSTKLNETSKQPLELSFLCEHKYDNDLYSFHVAKE